MYLNAIFTYIAFFVTCFLTNSVNSMADGWVNIDLQHALNSNDHNSFSYRGNISIPSLSSGLSTIVQDPLNEEQLLRLKKLAEKDGFYRLKAVVTYSTDIPSQTFLTATKACALMLSQLNDVLWLSTDSNGFITGITLTTSSSEKETCTNIQNLTEEDFNTDVLVRHCEIAPLPDTASFIQKIERERERGEVRDTRGFFAKYWMYIVPIVLVVLISGATNQEAAK